MRSTRAAEVAAHYTTGELEQRVLGALREAGVDPERLTPDDLAPVDGFHIRGRPATDELAELVELSPRQRVLDVGCGLGGTARHLAAQHGVEVTGIDLTAEYCEVGNLLSARTGLEASVRLLAGDALDLPFAGGDFDLVWTEHAAMNIADKRRLYGEMRRVLDAGGRLALYDIVQGDGGEVHFPVPWARRPEISFLASAGELPVLLEQSGFEVGAWRDVSSDGLEWFRRLAAAFEKDESPPLGFHLLMGPDMRAMFANQIRNLEQDRIRLVQVVAEAR